MLFARSVFILLAVVAFSGECRAGTVYQLDAANTFILGDMQAQFTAAGFLTVDTTVPVLLMDNCVVTASPCLGIAFHMSPGFDTGNHPAIQVFLLNGDQRFLYFDYGAFQTPGSHAGLFPFSPDEVVTLTVTSDVPEPSSAAVLTLLFAGAAIGRFRRKIYQCVTPPS